MNYPANQVLAMLRMYDALPANPHFVDVAILPAVQATVEAYLNTAHGMHRHEVFYRFQTSLTQQYRELVTRNDLWHVQNLECNVSATKLEITWVHPFMGTKRCIEFSIEPMTEAAADALMAASTNRLKELTLYIRDYNREQGKEKANGN